MPENQKPSSPSHPDRRTFLKGIGCTLAGVAVADSASAGSVQDFRLKVRASKREKEQSIMHFPLATNQYPWFTFYRRQGRDWEAELATAIADVKKSGADSLEPSLKSVEFVDKLCDELERQEVQMVSVYVNSELHVKSKAQESIDKVMAIVKRAKARMDTMIVVTNPSPIRWGGPENKNDDQLAVQRDALETLGKAIHREGMSLAYHFHDPEFREGAREVHHMLSATHPKYVKLCLDAHWAFRGAGDSNVALHDIVKLYGDRIVELHIRQSQNGVWTEAFGEGDIDYKRLTRELVDLGVQPLVTMEQAVEDKSPNTMDGLAAHVISHAKGREVFAPFIS